MKAVYKKLLNIKPPVLIEVKLKNDNYVNRYRILYPDGRCEYTNWFSVDFIPSCFCTPRISLEDSVKNMYKYDNIIHSRLKITKIQEIK